MPIGDVRHPLTIYSCGRDSLPIVQYNIEQANQLDAIIIASLPVDNGAQSWINGIIGLEFSPILASF